MNCGLFKFISFVLLLFQCLAVQANPFSYSIRESEEDAKRRFLFEQSCKKHPSLRIYHDEVEGIKNSDIYKFRPGFTIKKNLGEIGYGPVSNTFAVAWGMLEGVILAPVTIFGSPWILEKHLELQRVKKVRDIIYELYLEDTGSCNTERFLENLHLSYPEISNIQKLKLDELKQILIDLDQKGEFRRALYDNRIIVEEQELFSWSTPRRLLTIQELSDLVFDSLQGSTEA